MISSGSIAGVAVIALGIVLTPGPNMVYLASRSISQGRKAGMISLAGVILGFICYMFAAALGLSAIFEAVPVTYDIIRIVGAFYLGYLAWNMAKPKGASPFEAQVLSEHSTKRLFTMGLVTNLLNPKIALMYVALIPQFIDTSIGSTFIQFLQFGMIQITIAALINSLVVLGAGSISDTLSRNPKAMLIQRWVSGTVLGAFSVKTLLQT